MLAMTRGPSRKPACAATNSSAPSEISVTSTKARAPGRQALRGGTGETFEWGLLAGRRSKVPLILSGGLHAGNVAQAIALTHPNAVDTASGTEAAPGRKDPEKLRAFFDAVKRSAVERASIGQRA